MPAVAAGFVAGATFAVLNAVSPAFESESSIPPIALSQLGGILADKNVLLGFATASASTLFALILTKSVQLPPKLLRWL